MARDLEAILNAYSGLPLKDVPFREAIGRV
jgi:hypothetical protein